MIPHIENLQQLSTLETQNKLEGFYFVPDVVYFQSNRLSQSVLSRVISQSPRHAKHYYDKGFESTDAMDFGTMVHKLLLEPEDFKAKYAVAPKVDRRKKEGKELWTAFMEENPGKEIITKDDYDKAKYMLDGFIANDAAVNLVACGQYEVAMFWTDVETGLKMKAKVDSIDFEKHRLGDLKTTLSCADRSLITTIKKYNYAFQQAAYSDGYEALKSVYPQFEFIFVDKCNPSTTRLIKLSESVVAKAQQDYNRAIEIWQKCTKEGYWPSYGDTMQVYQEDLN